MGKKQELFNQDFFNSSSYHIASVEFLSVHRYKEREFGQIGFSSYSAFVSAYLSSAEDSSPLFPLPSLIAIAFFAPLDIYMIC
jgi:hypothetical protein